MADVTQTTVISDSAVSFIPSNKFAETAHLSYLCKEFVYLDKDSIARHRRLSSNNHDT